MEDKQCILECMAYKEVAHPEKNFGECCVLRSHPQNGEKFKEGWMTGRRVKAGLVKLTARKGTCNHGDRYGAVLREKIPFLTREYIQDTLKSPSIETLYGFGVLNVTLHDWKGTPQKGILCPNYTGPVTCWLESGAHNFVILF